MQMRLWFWSPIQHGCFPQQSVIAVFEIPSLGAFPGIQIWLWWGWIADCHPKSRICESGASCTWAGLFLVGDRRYRSPSASQGGPSVSCGDARGRYISRTWVSRQWASNAFVNTSSQADMKVSGCVRSLLVLVATPQSLYALEFPSHSQGTATYLDIMLLATSVAT